MLRFICAVVVLIYHYQHFFFPDIAAGITTLPAALPFYAPLWFIYTHGAAAVHIFWIISGLIFFHNYAARIFEGKVRSAQFFIRRFSRLYPLHFATLLLVAVLQIIYFRLNGAWFVYGANDWKHFLMQLVMASNWCVSSPYTFNGPIWSVSAEVLIYAIFFIVIKRFGGSSIVAAISCAIFLVIAHYSNATAGLWPLNHLRDTRDYDGIWLCGFCFFLGGLVNHAYLVTADLRRKFPAMWIAGLILLLFIATIAMRAFHLSGALATFLAMPPVILILLHSSQKLPTVVEKWLLILGNLTYASYLIHFPIQLLLVLVVKQLTGSLHLFYNGWMLPAFVIAVLLISRPVYTQFERPMQEMLRRGFAWRGGRQTKV